MKSIRNADPNGTITLLSVYKDLDLIATNLSLSASAAASLLFVPAYGEHTHRRTHEPNCGRTMPVFVRASVKDTSVATFRIRGYI